MEGRASFVKAPGKKSGVSISRNRRGCLPRRTTPCPNDSTNDPTNDSPGEVAAQHDERLRKLQHVDGPVDSGAGRAAPQNRVQPL